MRGNVGDDAALLRRVDVNITSFEKCDDFFPKAGETKIVSLTQETRQSNTGTDAALWRRTGAVITSFSICYKVVYWFIDQVLEIYQTNQLNVRYFYNTTLTSRKGGIIGAALTSV